MDQKLVEIKEGLYINPRQCKIDWVRSQMENGETIVKMEITCKKTKNAE